MLQIQVFIFLWEFIKRHALSKSTTFIRVYEAIYAYFKLYSCTIICNFTFKLYMSLTGL